MKEIKKIFALIGKPDITEDMKGLVANDIIDSMDILAIISEIQRMHKKPLLAKFITAENFDSFQSIKKMINEAYK